MKLETVAGFVVAGTLLLSSSCSGNRDSADFTEPGGTSPGGSNPSGGSSGGTGKGGSNASGAGTGGKAGAAQGGMTSTGGSSAGESGNEAGGASDGGMAAGGTSNDDQPDCDADFELLERSCKSASDCVLVEHQVDCCGSVSILGLSSKAKPAFEALEQYCAAGFPLCECPPKPTLLEDGSTIAQGSPAASAVADCIDNRCQSRNAQVSRACGDKTCSAAQYCEQFIGGVADSEPTYTCRPLGDCRSCDCLSLAGCQCSAVGGFIKVSCAAP